MDKVKIKGALKQKMESLELSGNKVSKLIGISSANVSNILNDKTESISDAIWLRVLDFCGMSSEWQAAKTGNMAKIFALAQDAQYNKVALAFSFTPGSGKSFALQYYKNHTQNVGYVECDEYWTKKILVHKIAASFGIIVQGSLHEMIESLVANLSGVLEPLIIIDEADKLSDACLNIFKTLFNRLLNQCGFILCGAPFFKLRIEKGVNRSKQAYQEIYSRIGGEFIPLNKPTSKDIAEVCRANGVSDAKTIQDFVSASKGDLRQVARMIHKYKKSSKQVA